MSDELLHVFKDKACIKTVKEIYLARCEKVTDVSLVKLIKRTPHLKILDINGDIPTKFTNKLLFKLAKKCKGTHLFLLFIDGVYTMDHC